MKRNEPPAGETACATAIKSSDHEGGAGGFPLAYARGSDRGHSNPNRGHRGSRGRSGQALMEFAVLYAAVILPLTFMTIFVAEMLWVWHGVVDFTRDGARYASTHCWTSDSGNVLAYMESHVPAIIDQAKFQNGDAGISVQYFSDGGITPFNGDNCAGACVPDTVSVSITNYQFLRFASFMKLPPVTIPPFTTSVPMESAGFQDASGVCVP